MKKTLFYLFILSIGFMGQSQTVLSFTYDTSGNQSLRKEDVAISRANAVPASDSIPNPEDLMSAFTPETIENQFTVSPNPTVGSATLRWDPMFTEQITSIELTSLITGENTPIVQTRGNYISIDLSGKVTGLYVVTFYLKNEVTDKVQKKIIKL
ncbi:hypothetical protein [uncultured Aquimarina sp.]|uniref:hypothetical protein n=1 Tax=uncultured Aquimarina sp. TaxID=575652 RepID=UPI002611EF00|nr:hypothetical protein [uncultured Aquimarina sp.]